MKVGVVSTSAIPYIIRDGDKYSGIAIDIWETAAKKAGLEFKYVEAGVSQEEAIQKLINKDFDILVGPYTITNKRYQHVDYTIPFYLSNIGLASSHKTNNLENYVNLTKIFASIIFLFIFILFANNFITNFNTKGNFADFFINSIPNFKNRNLYLLYAIIFCAIVIIYVNTFQPTFNLGATGTSIKNKKIIFRDEPNIKKIAKVYKSKGELIDTAPSSDHQKQIQNDDLFNHYIKNKNTIYGMIGDTSKFAYILHHNIQKYEGIKIIDKNLAQMTFAFIVPKKSEHLENINSAIREAQKEKINQIIVTKYLGPKFENNVTF